MSTPTERIQALIARAVHETTPEEEARSAAHIAVRLMTENNMEASRRAPRSRADLENEPVLAGALERGRAQGYREGLLRAEQRYQDGLHAGQYLAEQRYREGLHDGAADAKATNIAAASQSFDAGFQAAIDELRRATTTLAHKHTARRTKRAETSDAAFRAATLESHIGSVILNDVHDIRVITTKMNGVCLKCHKATNRGDVIAWCKGTGATHYECREYWTEDDSTTT